MLAPVPRSHLPTDRSVNRSARWSPRPTATGTSSPSIPIATIPSRAASPATRARRSVPCTTTPTASTTRLRRVNPKSESRRRASRWSPGTSAFADIGERLREIRREHGTEAVGCYWGNPLVYTSPGIATVYTFWGKMESTRLFGGLTPGPARTSSRRWTRSSASRRCSLRPTCTTPTTSSASAATPAGATSPRSRCPTRSKRSAASRPRGGDVTFVNPRRIRAVEMGLGDHLQIKPDTDAYLLAALLTEIDRLGAGTTTPRRARRNVDGLRGSSPRSTPTRSPRSPACRPTTSGARRATSPTPPLRSRTWAPAGTWAAKVRSSTGCSRWSTWSPGTSRCPGGGLLRSRPPTERFDELPERFFDSPVGPVRHTWGHVPANLMPEYVHAERDPLRALIVDRRQPDHGGAGRGASARSLPAARARRHDGSLSQRHRGAVRLRAPGERLVGAADYRSGGVAIRPTAQYSDAVGAAGRRPRRGVVDPRPARAGARPPVGARRRRRLRRASSTRRWHRPRARPSTSCGPCRRTRRCSSPSRRSRSRRPWRTTTGASTAARRRSRR